MAAWTVSTALKAPKNLDAAIQTTAQGVETGNVETIVAGAGGVVEHSATIATTVAGGATLKVPKLRGRRKPPGGGKSGSGRKDGDASENAGGAGREPKALPAEGQTSGSVPTLIDTNVLSKAFAGDLSALAEVRASGKRITSGVYGEFLSGQTPADRVARKAFLDREGISGYSRRSLLRFEKTPRWKRSATQSQKR